MEKNIVSRSEFARLALVTAGAVTKALRSALAPAAVGKRIDANHPTAVKYIEDHDPDNSNSEAGPATGIDVLYEQAVAFFQSRGKISTSSLQREFKIGYNRAKRLTDTIRIADVVTIATKAAPPPPEKKAPPPPEKKALSPARVVKGHEARNNTKKSESLNKLNERIEQGETLHEIPDDIKAFVHMTLHELLTRFGTETAFNDWLKATKSIEDINEKRLKNAITRGELVSVKLVKVGVIEHFDTAFNKLLSDGAKTIARRVVAMNGAGRTVQDCEEFVADQISSFIKPAKAKIARTLKNV